MNIVFHLERSFCMIDCHVVLCRLLLKMALSSSLIKFEFYSIVGVLKYLLTIKTLHGVRSYGFMYSESATTAIH